MAVKLNLLPEDYNLAGPIRQLLKLLKPLTVILLGLFIVTVLGMVGFFIFSSISLNNLNSNNAKLKAQIQDQETAQQEIVLLKDRVKLIQTVQKMPNAIKYLDYSDSFLGTLTGNSLITELDVDPAKISSLINFKSNLDLTNFFQNIYTNQTFNSITLSTFSYNPTGGYVVDLDFLGGK